MQNLSAYVEGMGIIGPGIHDWVEGSAILRGEVIYHPQKTVYPLVNSLPATERRRTGQVVKLALSVGHEAVTHANQVSDCLPAIFASSGGDSYNCHAICETLASDDRSISPTRFHNSVTNAPAGYWSIATGSMAPSTVICAFDASFGAGLLETLAQVKVDNRRCVLIAYDIDYPEPLLSVRPIPDGFGIALVLTPERTENSLYELNATLTQAVADKCVDTLLEELRLAIPAARALPMLQIMARGVTGSVVLDYLDTARISLELTPCT
jgi:hypothetical protein